MNTEPAGKTHTMTCHWGRFDHFKSFVRNLPAPAEFGIVTVLWCAPLALVGGFQLRKFLNSGLWEISNTTLILCPIIQLAALAAVLSTGKIRDWSLRTLGFRISWKGTGAGLLLAGAAAVATSGIWILVQSIHPEQSHFVMLEIAVLVVISHAIINPVFEEVLEVGYFVNALSRFGMWPTVLASRLLRALFHLWVGINGPLVLFPIGVVGGLSIGDGDNCGP